MKRYTAGIIALMMLVIILLSASFISSHIHHECTGEDCPVCACIQQCEGLLRGFGSSISGSASWITPILAALIIISLQAYSLRGNTPVSDKVRLNN